MQRTSVFAAAASLAFAVCGAPLSVAFADTFVLKSGGRIEGSLLNADQSPRESYLVSLSCGGKITLGKNMVARVISVNSAESQYEQYLQKMPATVEGHWKMAEWCVRNNLPAQREFHLREIIALDPMHDKARLALGYTNIDGRWVQPEEHNKRLGYVKFQGAWRTPQDVAIATARQQAEEAERKWRADVKTWRGWLNRPSKHEEGAARLRAIRDVQAAPAIADLLNDEKELPAVKLMCVDILGQMVNESGFARGTLVNHVLYNNDPQVREKAMDYVANCNPHIVGAMFVKALGDKKNEVVNRAAVGIARVKYEEAIPALIEALVTSHKYVVNTGSGNISANFGGPSGGLGGLSAGGGGPKETIKAHNNEAVKQALTALTGGQNLGYDKDRWRAWYAEMKTPQQYNMRRSP
jgi:hypothetical protein